MVEVWTNKETWLRGKSTAVGHGAWIVDDEAGRSMTPQRARTWSRIGQTPVVRVRGRRVSMADMACFKPGRRSQLIYAIREAVRTSRRASAGGTLGAPILLVWDNVRLRLPAGMKEFVDAMPSG
ncbi:hypothetical protein OG255_33565 [Streptomyces sp. NBC_01455]|nr:hypothetical protein [Streptomyces sp. NBC_01455]